MSAKTYTPRESEIERRWYVVDATDETLGRLATRIAHVLEGRHDFTAFAAATDKSPVRTVHAVRVRRQGSFVTIDVRAESFLRGMVRRIVAVLLEVGRGTMNELEVREALAARRPARNGASAPAKGLCLRHVALGRTNGENEER